jgi:hypothetical protein
LLSRLVQLKEATLRARFWEIAGGLLLAAACGPSSAPAAGEERISLPVELGPVRGSGQPPRLNEVQQKATHNSYQRDESVFDQLLYHGVRALEFDLHTSRIGRSVPQDWFVYHVLPSPEDTNCARFSDCLRVVKAFHDAMPEHEVVTLWLDIKDDLREAGHAAGDLDSAIARVFDRDAVLRPADLMARCPGATSLRQAVTGGCAWPTLEELRGKIVLALTGGSSCGSGSELGDYAATEPRERAAFIAPSIDDGCPFASYRAREDVIFFNMNAEYSTNAPAVHAAGLLGRVYEGGMTGGLDDKMAWSRARALRSHYLATDRVNAEEDAWATTRSSWGTPFSCFGGCPPARDQASARPIELVVNSEDIDGSRDSFYMVEAQDAAPDATFTAAIGTASSHIEPWAKGCLMARATADADSPYFAVCRPADRSPMRVQYRLVQGGETTVEEAEPPAGLSAESTFFASLKLSVQGGDTVATGAVSSDGVSFAPIAARTFKGALAHRGLAASSHGALNARFVFAGLKRNGEVLARAAFAARTAVGRDAAGFIEGN